MSSSSPLVNDSSAPVFDEDAAFEAFRSPTRRNLLLALAKGGPKAGDELKHVGPKRGQGKTDSQRLSATLKHLTILADAGILVYQADPRDRRCTIYGLAPGLKVSNTGTELLIDFGFCVLRFTNI